MKNNLNLFRNLLILLLLLVLAGGVFSAYQIYRTGETEDSTGGGVVNGFRKFIPGMNEDGNSESGTLFPDRNQESGQSRDAGQKNYGDGDGGQESENAGDRSPAMTEISDYAAVNFPGGNRRKVIFIGDSRTVGMYWALSGDTSLHEVHLEDTNGDLWSAKEGMGLAWMKSDGVPPVQKSIDEDSIVVILMGVNDIGSRITAADYLAYINEQAQDWTQKGALVYYTSVNPVRESLANGLSNAKIDSWNQTMQNGLSEDVQYIDTNTVISGNINFKDALHYKDATNLEIYRIIMETVLEGGSADRSGRQL